MCIRDSLRAASVCGHKGLLSKALFYSFNIVSQSIGHAIPLLIRPLLCIRNFPVDTVFKTGIIGFRNIRSRYGGDRLWEESSCTAMQTAFTPPWSACIPRPSVPCLSPYAETRANAMGSCSPKIRWPGLSGSKPGKPFGRPGKLSLIHI